MRVVQDIKIFLEYEFPPFILASLICRRTLWSLTEGCSNLWLSLAGGR